MMCVSEFLIGIQKINGNRNLKVSNKIYVVEIKILLRDKKLEKIK